MIKSSGDKGSAAITFRLFRPESIMKVLNTDNMLIYRKKSKCDLDLLLPSTKLEIQVQWPGKKNSLPLVKEVKGPSSSQNG